VGTGGCALDNESLWPLANHTIGRRITYDFVRGERRSLPPGEFGRERLGWFDELDVATKPITAEAWAAIVLGLDDPPDGPRHFFLDCSPGMASASIAVAVERDGRPHVELADYRTGAGWLVGRAVELRDRYPGSVFGLFGHGAAAALLPKLDEAGVDVESFTATDMAEACAHLQKAVTDGEMTRSADPLFATALAGAVKRDIGDGDLWSWSRKRSADISPLVASTGVLWLYERSPAYDLSQSIY